MSRPYTVYLGPQYSTEVAAGSANLTGSFAAVDWLEPLYMTHVANGEIGELRIIAHKHPEDANALIELHQAIRLYETLGEEQTLIFNGVVVKKHLLLQGEREQFEIVCYNNAEYLLHRIKLSGQWRLTAEREQDYFDDGPDAGTALPLDEDNDRHRIDSALVFNPDGLANCTTQRWTDENLGPNNPFYLFEVPGRHQFNADGTLIDSIPWKLSYGIAYLLNLSNADWAIDPDSYQHSALQVFRDHDDPEINNVNLEGRSLLEALRILTEPHNFGFVISPDAETNGKHTISFYYRTGATGPQIKTVRLSPRGTSSDSSTANAISIDLCIDSTPVVNTLTAYGNNITVTTLAHTEPPEGGELEVMKLIPGWREDDLIFAFDKPDIVNPFDLTFRKRYCHPDLITVFEGDDARTVYGVGRLWLINTGQHPDHDLEDLTSDLGGATSLDPRRFERPEFYNRVAAGGLLQQEDIQVEMSLDEGNHWAIVERSWYRVLSDGMGIVFTEPRLERLGLKFVNELASKGKTYWQALYDTDLRLRIVCSVKSDKRLRGQILNNGDSVPLATEGEFENTGYRRVVYNDAVFDSLYFTKYAPLQSATNHESALQRITSLQARNTDRLLISANVAVVLNEFGEYLPGDEISGISGRSLSFSPRPTIVRCVYDFTSKHVQLVLDNRRIRTVLTTKPIEEVTRDEHRHHVFAPSAVEGANRVPYLPGVDASRRQHYREGGGGQ